jgi:hypothetical protein
MDSRNNKWINKIEKEINENVNRKTINAFDRACERVARSLQGKNLSQNEIEQAAINLMRMERS